MWSTRVVSSRCLNPLSDARRIACKAGKGFGNTKPSTKKDAAPPSKGPKTKRAKGKGKQTMRLHGNNLIQQKEASRAEGGKFHESSPLQDDQLDVFERYRRNVEAQAAGEQEFDAAFEERLAALKQDAAQRQAAPQASEQAVDILAASPQSLYANPPSLGQSLSQLSPSTGDDDSSGPASSSLGKQIAIAAGAVVLGAALLLTSGLLDAVPGSSPLPEQQGQASVSPDVKSQLEAQASRLEDQLKAEPENAEALEAAAVTYANLGQTARAEALLTKLTAARPNYADAWQLLGQTRAGLKDFKGASAAYQRAAAASGFSLGQPPLARSTRSETARDGSGTGQRLPDLDVLTGWMGALVAQGKPADAVSVLEQAKAGLPAAGLGADATAAALPGDSGPGTPAAASGAADTADADAAATGAVAPEEAAAGVGGTADGGAASTALQQPGLYELELLTAKVYSQWKGHGGDALAVYDRLIKQYPEDYRGFLARGVLLREEGRKGDAQRMFLQARFLAPKEARGAVDRIAKK